MRDTAMVTTGPAGAPARLVRDRPRTRDARVPRGRTAHAARPETR
ncbi:hypothetical protein [Streptomyces sp. NPDC018045]